MIHGKTQSSVNCTKLLELWLWEILGPVIVQFNIRTNETISEQQFLLTKFQFMTDQSGIKTAQIGHDWSLFLALLLCSCVPILKISCFSLPVPKCAIDKYIYRVISIALYHSALPGSVGSGANWHSDNRLLAERAIGSGYLSWLANKANDERQRGMKIVMDGYCWS